MNTPTPRFLIWIFLCALSPTLFAAPPPELTVLRQQYDKVFAERVTAVFDASKAGLDSKFTTALDNAIATAKGAGELKTVLALEAEKKRLTDKLPIPAEDIGGPEALQKLRIIYQEQLTKLEEARAANHSALLPAYTAKLQQLEVTLTKADRVAEAAEVLTYREGLSADAPSAAAPLPAAMASTPASQPPAPTTTDDGPKVSEEEASRQLAEWALQNGHEPYIRSAKGYRFIKTAADLPAEKFQLIKLESRSGAKTTPPWRMFQYTPQLDRLFLGLFKIKVQPSELALLHNLEKLVHFEFKAETDDPAALAASMPELKSLKSLTYATAINSDSIATIVKRNPQLSSFGCQANGQFSESEFAALSQFRELETLRLDFLDSAIPEAAINSLASMKSLKRLILFDSKVIPFTTEQAAKLPGITSVEVHYQLHLGQLPTLCALPSLEKLALMKFRSISDDDIKSFGNAKRLNSLVFEKVESLTDSNLSKLLVQIPKLTELHLLKCSGIQDASLEPLAGTKTLKVLTLRDMSQITETGRAKFKKQRPDIQINP
jgi:flagellar biosynthesis chaperone FliJ